MSEPIQEQVQEPEEPKGFEEVKEVKKRRKATEKQKQAGANNLKKHHEIKKKQKELENKLNADLSDDDNYMNHGQTKIVDDDEIDIETLLDKKLKKKQDKLNKYELLKNLEAKNALMYSTIEKMNDRIEKLYGMKKNKIRNPQQPTQTPQPQPQPIIIETTRPVKQVSNSHQRLMDLYKSQNL